MIGCVPRRVNGAEQPADPSSRSLAAAKPSPAQQKILGIENLYTEKDLSYEDVAPPFSPCHERLSKLGTIGYFYQDPRHHACPHANVSLQKGLEFVRLQVDALVAALKDLSAYVEEVKGQPNQGWSR